MDYKKLKDRQNLYKVAIEKWGNEEQLKMLQEEATELALATRKFTRKATQQTADDLCGEVADVEIMIEQLKFMNPKFKKDIEAIKVMKLTRLRERLGDSSIN